MKIVMYYVESKLPFRSFFCQQDSPTHGHWSTFLIWIKIFFFLKYIPLTLNTWIEGGYKTKAFMSYSVQSWASWIVIWLLLLLVITSLWAPLLELFLQLRSATMRIRRLTIATASLTHESTCSSLYVTKRSMKLYQIFNIEK